jgi:hypothetical protein
MEKAPFACLAILQSETGLRELEDLGICAGRFPAGISALTLPRSFAVIFVLMALLFQNSVGMHRKI